MALIPNPPFQFTSGPKSARIVMVGEAWGENEKRLQKPFVGASGKELFSMLGHAWPQTEPSLHRLITSSMWRNENFWMSMRDSWLAKAEVLWTNVFPHQPFRNDMDQMCLDKKSADAVLGGKGAYTRPPLRTGKYIHPQWFPELDRLAEELRFAQPNLVIAFGNTATWALLNTTKIGSIRGATAESTLVPGLKILPTYHPAAVLRNWALRPIVVADLMKAAREAQFADIRRPQRRVIVNPCIGDIVDWAKRQAEKYAVDIETTKGQISMIGFARSRDDALVIPFIDPTKPNGSYWENPHHELIAWEWVKTLLERPQPKIFQNGLYDLQYILRMGFRPRNCLEDTMLLHHALFPELQKGLGFLGSIYTNEGSWKLMRHADINKKDE